MNLASAKMSSKKIEIYIYICLYSSACLLIHPVRILKNSATYLTQDEHR